MPLQKPYKPQASGPAPNVRDLVPHSYLLRVTPSRCAHCGTTHYSAETFLVRIAPALTHTTGFRQLTPVESMSMPLPVGQTTLLPKTIAFCHDCIEKIPDVSPRKETTPESWSEALRADARAAKPKPSPAREPQTAKDIDF